MGKLVEAFQNIDFSKIAELEFDRHAIKTLIEELGYSERRFALIVGTPYANLERWLNGERKPAADCIARMIMLAKIHDIDFLPVRAEQLKPKQTEEKITAQELSAIANAKFNPAPIIQLMENLEFSQTDLAKAVGTGQSNVSKWIKGQPPGSEYLVRMKALADSRGVTFNPI